MIKSLTLLVLVFISFCVNAQIKKGTFLIGGQLSAGKFEREPNYPFPQPTPYFQGDNFKYVNVGISIGKAIKNNQVIGFNFNTATSKQTISNNGTESTLSKNNLNEVGIFYRAYKKIGNGFYFFGQGNALVNFGKTQYYFINSINNSTVKQTGGS